MHNDIYTQCRLKSAFFIYRSFGFCFFSLRSKWHWQDFSVANWLTILILCLCLWQIVYKAPYLFICHLMSGTQPGFIFYQTDYVHNKYYYTFPLFVFVSCEIGWISKMNLSRHVWGIKLLHLLILSFLFIDMLYFVKGESEAESLHLNSIYLTYTTVINSMM